MAPSPKLPLAADLYNDLDPGPTRGWRDLTPGLIVAALATMAAGFVADHYAVPLTLMALLIGLALNFLNAEPRTGPGLGFASKTLLRWGIVLAGARLTLDQVIALGPQALAAVLVILFATLAAGVLAARLLGLGSAFGTMAGGAVAICGASAALALATTLGERRASQAQLALVLVGISSASAAAMFFYPLICHQLGLGDRQAGFVLGAAIHDVAQALGAGYGYSDGAGQIAAIVKLTRVALLAPILALVAAWYRPADGGSAGIRIPWFVAGFFILGGINSTGIIPVGVARTAQDIATWCLACAVAATGIRAPMGSLLETGVRPLLVIVIASLVALLLSLGAATALL